MINPTEADVGRKVVYRPQSRPSAAPEEGVITSLNERFVFVRYGLTGSAATRREDLEWAHESPRA